MNATRRSRAAVVAVIVGFALFTTSTSNAVQSSRTPAEDVPVLALPEPSGSHPVGVSTVHLRDPDRADPWMPGKQRELMASLYYPALLPLGRLKPYVTRKESRLLLSAIDETSVPDDILSTTRTQARIGAPPLPVWHGLALVVLSPGVSLPRTSLTALAEDLASRGYVVAAVDHTYEAIAVTFPDGRITECLICEDRPPGPVATRSRAADISFVLDELTGRHSPWWGHWLIDPDRIAMAGHSLGGAGTLATMLTDGRVRAGINLDGPFLPPLETATNRPFMLFGAAHRQPGDDESWDVTWEHLTGWRRWLTVDGTDHNSVNDYGLLFDQLGIPTPDQTLPGARAVAITRAYVGAFVDRHLRQRPSRLLAGPSSRYPEVRFQP